MQHKLEEIIIEQYQIIDFLGSGLGGETYKALDLNNEQLVALKILSLHKTSNWKILELFEREANTLAQLKHSRIPDYLNYFQIDNTQDSHWYLVQEFVSGQSLSTLVDNGWRATEEEIINIAAQILEILIYLHNFKPPVIHRDIKPQNIIRQSDGKIYLVDFGAVNDIYRQTLIGSSTVVGTYGYMAPEQFRGQAVPSTDLYGLGATLLYLLTHSSPAEFPQNKLKIDFRSSINVSEQLGNWLEIMLEPVIEDRFESASQALAVLKGDKRINTWQNYPLRKPAYSKITVDKAKDRINFVIPHNKGEQGEINNLLFFLYISLFILIITLSPFTSSSNLSITNELIVRTVLSIPLVIAGLYFLFNYLFSIFGHTKLEIDIENFYLTYILFGLQRTIVGETKNITEAKILHNLIPGGQYSIFSAIARCAIVEGTKVRQFGRYIKRVEKKWLVKEIMSFLRG